MARRTTNPVLLGELLDNGPENTSMDQMSALPNGADSDIQGIDPGADLSDMERVLFEVGEASDDSKINVYRVERGKADAYLFQCLPAEFSLDVILQRYGGGTYRVRGYTRRETGALNLFVNRTVTLEEPKNGIGSVNPNAPVVNDRLSDVLQAIVQQGQQTQQLIAALAQNQNGNGSRKEMLQEILMMRDVFAAPPVAPAAPAVNPLSSLKDALELVQTIRGEQAAAEDPIMGGLMQIVQKMAPTLIEGIAAQTAATKADPTVSRETNPAPVFAPLPQIAAPQNPSGEDMQFMVNMALEKIGATAAKGEPTMPVAEMIADFADKSPDVAKIVDTLLTKPDWFAMVEQRIPGATAHKDWYDRLRTDLAGLYE